MAANDALTPRPEHRFTFGLWTVGNPGRDPFGGPTRPPLDPVDLVRRLAGPDGPLTSESFAASPWARLIRAALCRLRGASILGGGPLVAQLDVLEREGGWGRVENPPPPKITLPLVRARAVNPLGSVSVGVGPNALGVTGGRDRGASSPFLSRGPKIIRTPPRSPAHRAGVVSVPRPGDRSSAGGDCPHAGPSVASHAYRILRRHASTTAGRSPRGDSDGDRSRAAPPSSSPWRPTTSRPRRPNVATNAPANGTGELAGLEPFRSTSSCDASRVQTTTRGEWWPTSTRSTSAHSWTTARSPRATAPGWSRHASRTGSPSTQPERSFS